MSLLLDTHTLLWWLAGAPIADEVEDRIADPTTRVVVSSASIWEIEIKRALGKLEAPRSVGGVVVEEGFSPLPIAFAHAERAGSLPAHHRDPFDRMLVAQAQLEGLAIVSRDEIFDVYDVTRIRC